jgi:hypothetical protein
VAEEGDEEEEDPQEQRGEGRGAETDFTKV